LENSKIINCLEFCNHSTWSIVMVLSDSIAHNVSQLRNLGHF
jgi:hypothetical protein